MRKGRFKQRERVGWERDGCYDEWMDGWMEYSKRKEREVYVIPKKLFLRERGKGKGKMGRWALRKEQVKDRKGCIHHRT